MKFLKFFKKQEPVKRKYAAAAINRLTSDWLVGTTSADSELYRDLRTLRGRSRELCINNDYARRFLKRTSTNVIGSSGIKLQLRSQNTKPEINSEILKQFELWGKRGNCTVDGRLSWIDCQRLFLEGMARDGELIVRLVEGFNNDFGFALQFIEADHLDENLNHPLTGDHYIRMGIEFNQWNKPIAYHLLQYHPGDNFNQSEQKYTRIPAEQIIHGFLVDRPSQSRGVPWMHGAMTRLRMLAGYEEAELVAARVGAAKMGFFVSTDGTGYVGAEDALGNKIMEAEPGTFEQLPTGMDVRMFDPNHPTSSFADFEKSILRGIASGLDISYATLANDLENVNFSSIRHGSLEDRDTWRMLQVYVIEHFCDRVFEKWLLMAITSKCIRIPIQDFDQYNKPIWRPRGWAWVDPLKDSHANEIAIAQKTRTRSQIAADQGNDIEEIFQQLVFEEELAKKYGLKLADQKTKETEVTNEDESDD
jgi:lambda family phage portal protein